MPDDTTRLIPPEPAGDATAPPAAHTEGSDTLLEPAPEPRPDPPPGYDLLDEIGRGGMGVVYRARDRALRRTVALKFLRRGFDPAGVEGQRFLQEAQITSQLQHPGIPPVHHVGTLPGGRPFIVMKLIEGDTLHARLKACRTAADRGRLLPVFERVCQAVGYAHARRVIHRDLKPANVMVGAFGEVQVMDWGLAKSLAAPGEGPPDSAAGLPGASGGGLDSVTETGSILGTPAFMPPEQAAGEHDRIDERSDVFGLGAVLCAILTGEPPYVGPDSAAVALQAIQGQTNGARGRLAACGGDPDLVALCRRCLAAEPADRPGDGNELAEAVAELRAVAEERARVAELDRVRAEAAHREQRHRRRVRAALAGAAAVLLAAGAAVAWWADRQADRRARQEAELRAADLRRQLADEQLAAERRERLGRNAGTVAGLLGECEAALRADDGAAAAVVLAQAEGRAADGGAVNLAPRLARARADLDLLLELERIDDQHWTVRGGKTQGERPAAAKLPAAFARYGIIPGKTPPGEAAARIRDSLVRDHILTALDRWLEWSRAPEVLALLRAADPDDFRDAMRAAVAARDAARVRELAAKPEALAQPARYAAAFGEADLPAPRRGELVLAALRRRPGDHRLLVTLGYLAMISAPGAPLEYEKWFRAAVAVRPRSPVAHNYLGLALLNNKQPREAVAEFREATRLEPRYAGAHNNLGVALDNLGDKDGAIGAFRQAADSAPDYMLAHANLATLLEERGDLDEAVRRYDQWIQLDPKGPLALRRLAWILATAPDARLRNAPRALALATRACALTAKKDPECLDALAAALAEAGDFDEAVAAEKRALSFPAFERDSGAAARHRLSLYRRKLAYHTAHVAPPPHEVKPQ